MSNINQVPVTRRQFLARTGGAAVGMAALMTTESAHAGDDAKVLIGSGSHTYECLHDWLIPPSNIVWGDTQGVAEDSAGRLYVSHTVHSTSQSRDAIVVFDKNGKFLTSWGSRFDGGGHGLDLRREADKKEYLYHCDTKHQVVVKTTLDGTVVWEKGKPEESGVYKDGARFVPTNVAFAPDGGFYIADGYGSSFVHQYDSIANYIRTFGGKGTDAGKFNTPHGLWVDMRHKNEPLLAVADRENHRLQYMTLDGKHVRFEPAAMRRPCQVNFRGDEMVVPDLLSVVTILDKDNKPIVLLGDGDPSNLRSAPRSQYIPGKFIHPHDAQFLKNGNILVAEWVPTGRITLLRHVKA